VYEIIHASHYSTSGCPGQQHARWLVGLFDNYQSLAPDNAKPSHPVLEYHVTLPEGVTL
jgi:hypothetical protein